MDTSSIKTFDYTLCKYIKVTLIKKVKVNDNDTKAQKEAKCEARKGYWQIKETTESMYPPEIKEKAEADSALPISNLYLFSSRLKIN